MACSVLFCKAKQGGEKASLFRFQTTDARHGVLLIIKRRLRPPF